MAIGSPVEAEASLYPGGVMRTRDQFYVSAYWFGTNVLWGALLIVLVPSQMKHLAPQRPAEMTGLVLGLGAIAGLVIPLLVGPLSDRCMSRWGRRRPYMVVGVAINLVGLAMLWIAGRDLLLWLYFVGYFISNFGNNISTASYSGVIPDIVPEPQRGAASGWMGAMQQLGTIFGVLSSGVLARLGNVSASYAVIAITLVLFLGITVAGIRERPRREAPGPLDLLSFLKRLWIDPRQHPDFAWVWITRALVTMGFWTVQEFLQFYLTDVAGVSEGNKEVMTALLLVTVMGSATITGLIGGGISDRIGRKRVVYVANSVIALGCFAFIVSPSLAFAFVIAAVFGLGYGAYVSVDWALGCDVLPDKGKDAAKDMAVWHVSMVLPQSLILPVAGALLGAFGKTEVLTEAGKVTHYTLAGYTAIFVMAGCFLLLGAVLLRNVRGVR
jgi:MFS family permease